ncbi:MAG: hypothetical protein HZA24_05865 [Nitrospirae bacterium]|nr:hypothetical protein [Nitrospirota bacterium]
MSENSPKLPAFDPLEEEPRSAEYQRRYKVAGKVFDIAGDDKKIEVLLAAAARTPDDYAAWRDRPVTTLEVAVCLLLEMPEPGGWEHNLWREHEPEFSKIVERAKGDSLTDKLAIIEHLGSRFVKPAAFLAWAKVSGYEIPAGMVVEAQTANSEKEDPSCKGNDAPGDDVAKAAIRNAARRAADARYQAQRELKAKFQSDYRDMDNRLRGSDHMVPTRRDIIEKIFEDDTPPRESMTWAKGADKEDGVVRPRGRPRNS